MKGKGGFLAEKGGEYHGPTNKRTNISFTTFKRGRIMKVVILGIIMMASLTHAQLSNSISILGGAGLFVPVGDSSEYVTNGLRLNAIVGFKINRVLDLGVEFAYNKFAANVDKIKSDAGFPSDMKIDSYAHIIEISAVPTIYLYEKDNIGIYGIFGAGLHLFKSSATATYQGLTQTSETTDQNLGVNFGAGMEFKVNEKIKIGIVPRYHIVFTDDTSTKYFTASAYIKL
jgi:opacity protein-like surface antigen